MPSGFTGATCESGGCERNSCSNLFADFGWKVVGEFCDVAIDCLVMAVQASIGLTDVLVAVSVGVEPFDR